MLPSDWELQHYLTTHSRGAENMQPSVPWRAWGEREREGKAGGERAALHGNTENCPCQWEFTQHCFLSQHLMSQTSAMLGQTQLQQPQWCEEAASFPMASRRQLLPMHPPNSGYIFLCLRDTPQFEKLLSPLVPSSSPRQLVSGTLDFFSYLSLLKDQQWSTGS